MLPFDNTLVVIASMAPSDVKAMLELSASLLPSQFGGFLQIAGFDVTTNRSLPAGSRVVSAVLDDGTPIVTSGVIDPAAPASLSIVTNNLTANGGDGHAVLAGKQKTTLRDGDGLAIPYELGLRDYLLSFAALGGRPALRAGPERRGPDHDPALAHRRSRPSGNGGKAIGRAARESSAYSLSSPAMRFTRAA